MSKERSKRSVAKQAGSTGTKRQLLCCYLVQPGQSKDRRWLFGLEQLLEQAFVAVRCSTKSSSELWTKSQHLMRQVVCSLILEAGSAQHCPQRQHSAGVGGSIANCG